MLNRFLAGFGFVLCLFAGTEAFAKADNCATGYASYRQEAIHRAFATTAHRNPRGSSAMSCGWANGFNTKESPSNCRSAENLPKRRSQTARFWVLPNL